MKRFCISLCVLALFSTTLLAQNKPCQSDKGPTFFGCTCALTDFGDFWIGEHHPEIGSCQNPQPVFLPGESYSYGICDADCNSCFINVGPHPIAPYKPRLTKPAPPTVTLNPVPKYHEVKQQKFVNLRLKKGEQPILVKLLIISVDIKQMADDLNVTLPPNSDLHKELVLGFQISNFPSNVDPDVLPILTSTTVTSREAYVDCLLGKAIVLLAE